MSYRLIKSNFLRLLKGWTPYWVIDKFGLGGAEIKWNSNKHPKLFGDDGQEVVWFYLKDDSCKHTTYNYFSACQMSNHIFWDRMNKGLNNEMHTYWYMDNKGRVNGKKYFALLLEGREIIPEFYEYLLRHSEIINSYDAIFTNQSILFEKYENAYFVPSCSTWYGSDGENAIEGEEAFLCKNKMISIISSNKNMCKLHGFRRKLAQECKKSGIADAYGNFDGGEKVKTRKYLENYRYHIAIENQISNGYFTEKITNCFLSMTVPIYVGAPDIGNYFNMDGIIYVPEADIDNIYKYLEICSEKDYERRMSALRDNYQRVQNYKSVEEYIYRNYKDLIL